MFFIGKIRIMEFHQRIPSSNTFDDYPHAYIAPNFRCKFDKIGLLYKDYIKPFSNLSVSPKVLRNCNPPFEDEWEKNTYNNIIAISISFTTFCIT